MFPYFIVYILVALSSFFLSVFNNSKFRFFFYFIILMSLSSLFYIRDFSIGIDTLAYSEIISDTKNFNGVNDLINYSEKYNIELGFLLFCYIFIIFDSISLVFWFFSLVIFLNLSLVLKNIKINPFLYYLSFFSYFGIYLLSFNILRQAIALSFIFLATSFLIKNNNRLFFTLIFIAGMFHYSAFICLIFFFIYKKINFFYRIRYLFLVCMVFFSSFIIYYISSMYDRYSTYSDSVNTKQIGYFLLGFYIISFLISNFFVQKIYLYKKEMKFFIVIFSIYFSLQFSFIINGISNFGTTRIVFYFLWPVVLMWGILLLNIKDTRLRYVLNFSFFGFLFFYWCVVISNSGYDIVPFRFNF